ncbi:T9SS type A sorting domain-containing protein [Xanthomarina sp. F2636L]|uniref:T9SS type A sorting domain-containing protein n=1 Tax=Xanthomarina sp. F2636L TaxID=2996018 RepID=UPI00225E3AAF|nr:T9SS type A sorting domain-containing protein [Xanthomarina sp. F2636L]MCX7549403.1 T9SS type A sorting domain-containing protein [Xanthomarina sp. F2636L]
MKIITFLLVLVTFGIQAQTFPSPYCSMADAASTTVEEFTALHFADYGITNTDTSSVLIDKTTTVIDVTRGTVYSFDASGNTYGDFDNNIVAFIDWNHNDVLDDAGEIYEVGTLTNSSGDDGVYVSMNISVPPDAAIGSTRIRITKVYTDDYTTAVIDPCAISMEIPGYGIFPGYGQALDFILEVNGNFPSPYCAIINATDVPVEEITTVNFAGTSISNTITYTVLIDETASVVDVAGGETYTLEVSGNTHGDSENNIVAFIDWNQNYILDDAGEIYDIGTLSNSTGSDGISVSLDITVPTDAVLGTTRIRIIKSDTNETYPIDFDPCNIFLGTGPGYGQGLDFTLNIMPLSIETFDIHALSVYPIPVNDVLNVKYKSALSAVKIYNLLGQEVYVENAAASHLQVDVSSLRAGAYIVKVYVEEAIHSFRILKQ